MQIPKCARLMNMAEQVAEKALLPNEPSSRRKQVAGRRGVGHFPNSSGYFKIPLRSSAQNRPVQQYRNRALQKLNADDHPPFVPLFQDNALDAAKRTMVDPDALSGAEKWPGPHRKGGTDQRPDSADLFFRQRRSSVTESDNRSHSRHAQHRNPSRRIFKSGEHVTRKQWRIQNFYAVRPDALVFVSRKESFNLAESGQPL